MLPDLFSKLLQPERGFRYGIDSFLLARFAQCKPSERVCDLGAGVGILGFLAIKRTGVQQVIAVEVQAESVAFLVQNIAILGLSKQVEVIASNWCDYAQRSPRPQFDLIISNPPYRQLNTGKVSPELTKNIARHEVMGGLPDLVQAARSLMSPQARFCVMYPPLRLEELMLALREQGLKAQRMASIHPYADRPATQVLIEAVRAPTRELQIEAPIIVYQDADHYRPEIEAWVGPKRRQG